MPEGVEVQIILKGSVIKKLLHSLILNFNTCRAIKKITKKSYSLGGSVNLLKGKYNPIMERMLII